MIIYGAASFKKQGVININFECELLTHCKLSTNSEPPTFKQIWNWLLELLIGQDKFKKQGGNQYQFTCELLIQAAHPPANREQAAF